MRLLPALMVLVLACGCISTPPEETPATSTLATTTTTPTTTTSSITRASTTTTITETKDYFNVNSPDFNPAMAGKPNPRNVQTPRCCHGPYYQSVWRAYSNDGLTWSKEGKMIVDHAGVPDILVKDDGTQILYYVNGSIDNLDCLILEDGKMRQGNCRIYNFSGTKAVDPEVVKLDGYYRLYYSTPPGMDEQTNAIRTAVSRDGIAWLDEDVALEGIELIDPTVMKTDVGWVMMVRTPEGMIHASSRDGVHFTKERMLGELKNAVSPHLTMLDGRRALYYCSRDIYVSFTDDWASWKDETIAIQGEANSIICDPSVEKQKDGRYVMYYKKQATG